MSAMSDESMLKPFKLVNIDALAQHRHYNETPTQLLTRTGFTRRKL